MTHASREIDYANLPNYGFEAGGACARNLTVVNARDLHELHIGTPFRSTAMTKVLVLYYSSYGHVEAMANAEAEGARAGGAHVVVKRVPELVPLEIARKSGFKLDQLAPDRKSVV